MGWLFCWFIVLATVIPVHFLFLVKVIVNYNHILVKVIMFRFFYLFI